MEVQHIDDVIRVLRQSLQPIEQAVCLFDSLEGLHPQARKAAVLVGLFEQNGITHLAFIRRATTLRSHSGEIAFPGGAVEPADLSPVETALREAHEEIGLEPERVEVLGLLQPIFTVVSNYVIQPVVGFLPQGIEPVRLQESEVAGMIYAPLPELVNPAVMHTETWTRDGVERIVYFYDYGQHRIWGATARMLHELLTLLQNVS